ncbi:MAG: hypothetical protein M1308_01985 [Actinobacteria bacterium]|nr:hypothetical protein [Actinomycetota bacterium]
MQQQIFVKETFKMWSESEEYMGMEQAFTPVRVADIVKKLNLKKPGKQ